MEPRIPPLVPPYPDDVEQDLRKMMPPGVPPIALFRVVANNARVLARMRRGSLLDPGSISLRQRELVILRTTALCRAEYEWSVHAAFFGAAAGFTPAQLVATVHAVERPPSAESDDLWTDEEKLLLELVSSLHVSADVDDSLWHRLALHFTSEQLIELVFLVGLYHAVSFTTNALRLPLEPGAPRFPERAGTRPVSAPPPVDAGSTLGS